MGAQVTASGQPWSSVVICGSAETGGAPWTGCTEFAGRFSTQNFATCLGTVSANTAASFSGERSAGLFGLAHGCIPLS